MTATGSKPGLKSRFKSISPEKYVAMLTLKVTSPGHDIAKNCCVAILSTSGEQNSVTNGHFKDYCVSIKEIKHLIQKNLNRLIGYKYLLPIGLNGSKTESQLTIFNSEIEQQNCSPVHPRFLERSRFKPCLRPLPVAVCIRLYLRDLHAVAIGWDEGP